jgi:hypothetical protein
MNKIAEDELDTMSTATYSRARKTTARRCAGYRRVG